MVECGDIAAAGTAERLVAAATATGLPLRGVLHAAAVVEDATLANITDELVERDWAPKVYGAWNLHQATASQPLDWFCSFSSAAALVGSPGQGAYAAANSWLDAFMHWRRAQGLPASAIAWGAWAQIGRGTAMAEGDACDRSRRGRVRVRVVAAPRPRLHRLCADPGHPVADRVRATQPVRSAFKSAGQSSTEGRRLRTELAALPREEWPTRLRRLISEQVGLILRRAIDPDRPLSEYGLDSLGNLELRTRIEAETGVRISSMGVSTVRASGREPVRHARRRRGRTGDNVTTVLKQGRNVFALEAIHDWVDAPGELISWNPSPATRGEGQEAPVADVPASYQQAQHLRSYREHARARHGDGAADHSGVEHPRTLRYSGDDARDQCVPSSP